MQYSKLLAITLVILGLIFLWVLSIGAVYWDISRRKLQGGETAFWMALVVLAPGIGFAAYIFYRLLGTVLTPNPPAGEPPKRQTMLKRSPEPPRRTSTIPAVDLVRPTFPEAPPKPPLQETAIPVNRSSPEYRLAVVEGPHAGREYILARLPAILGRGPEAAIGLDQDLGVSRQHAELYEQDGVLRIRDMKSTHGTYVNDFSIEDKSLDPGDRIRVGLSTLVVAIKEKQR